MRYDRGGRKLERLLKSIPRQQTAEEIESIVPLRTASWETRFENTGKDKCEDCDHHNRIQHSPQNSQDRSFIARGKFALGERHHEIKATGKFPQRSPHSATRGLG